MFSAGFTYVAGNTPVHRLDARVKIVALLAFSIALLFVQSWVGLCAFAVTVGAVAVLARIPLRLMGRMLVPVFALAAFSFACNVIAHPGLEGVSVGGFFAVRMIVLVAASFVVCLTTTSAQLLNAFTQLISPLRRLRIPVDDIACTLALSVRFIPVIEHEFARISAAQLARGAESAPTFKRRMQIWASAFFSLFVGLFRHADSLADAMDARCYGAAPARTRLQK